MTSLLIKGIADFTYLLFFGSGINYWKTFSTFRCFFSADFDYYNWFYKYVKNHIITCVIGIHLYYNTLNSILSEIAPTFWACMYVRTLTLSTLEIFSTKKKPTEKSEKNCFEILHCNDCVKYDKWHSSLTVHGHLLVDALFLLTGYHSSVTHI